MQADSLPGRIVGALARAPSKARARADASADPRNWAVRDYTVLPRRLRGLSRDSVAGRLVAALARAETAAPAAPAFQPVDREPTIAVRRTKRRSRSRSPEAPSYNARLTIVLAGQEPARTTPKPVAVSSPSFPSEPSADERPTLAARLRISVSPARM
jgi:hypothetical protein